MKPPPIDSDTMIECPRCADVLTYGQARALKLYPTMNDGFSSDGPASLQATAVIECRCGHTAVDIQQRGTVVLAIPRPGQALGGSSGTDSSVIL